MSRMKELISRAYKKPQVLDEIFGYEVHQISSMIPVFQRIEDFYVFDEEGNMQIPDNPFLHDLELRALNKYLQVYGESKKYGMKEIVDEAIDDVVHAHTYTGKNDARDISELQHVFSQKFSTEQDFESLKQGLKEQYEKFSEAVGIEKAEGLVYSLAMPAAQYTFLNRLKDMKISQLALQDKENGEERFKLQVLKKHDEYRVKFQEILLIELYKDINSVLESPALHHN